MTTTWRVSRSAVASRAGAVAVGLALLAACVPPPFTPTPHPRCPTPESCTLTRAGRAAGVEVGLFPQDFGAESQAIIAREAGLVVNHHFSWNVIEPARGQWNFGPADAVADFARRNGLRHYGFHFAWDNEALDDFPAWVGEIEDPTELRAVIRERARVIFERYPHLDGIDVINEPIETFGGSPYPNHFLRVLGPDYVAQLFEIVESEAPRSTRLFVNENFVEFNATKADALVALVADLLDRGARVDAVGLQTHLFGEPDWDLYRDTMERLAALGVAVMVTELDVPVQAAVADRYAVQAQRYRRVIETCLAVPACDTVNVWGVDDAHTWIDSVLGPGTDPLLFDRWRRPKAAYFAVRDALLDGRPRL